MLRSISLLLILIAAGSASVTRPPDRPASVLSRPAAGFVHLSGRQLVDGQNRPLRLKGVSLGGWLMWESWIVGGGLNSESWMMKTLAGRTSPAYAQAFREKFYRQFITRDDVRAMKEQGFNSVRVPFNHAFFDNGSNTGTFSEAHFGLMDQFLGWCEEFDPYVIPDMHGAPGGQNPLFISDPDAVKLWASEQNKAGMVRLWKAIAARYKNRRIILGYDLLNEPAQVAGKDLVSLYERVVRSIREEDPNHLLIVEGAGYAKDFSMFSGRLDDNQLFSFHFYPWLQGGGRQEDRLQAFHAFAEKVGAPLWCGEWGEADPATLAGIRNRLRNDSYLFCGDAFWPWKKVKLNNRSHPLNRIVAADAWMRTIKNQPKLSTQSYQEIADAFLEAVLYRNNVPDAEVLKAVR